MPVDNSGFIQIKLTEVNVDGLSEYLKVFGRENPEFHASPTQIVNRGFAEWLKAEIEIRKEKKNDKRS